MIFTAGVVGWDEHENFPSHRLDGQFAPGAAQHARDPRRGRRRARAYRPHDLLRHRPRTNISLSATRSAPVWKAIMGAHYPAMALVEVKGLVEQRGAGRDRDDGGGAGVSYDTLRRRPPAAAGAAAGIPLRPARAAISRAAERGGGAAQGRRRRTPWPSSTTMAAGPIAELDDFSGRIARLLVEEQGLIPGNRVLLRGPNGYTMFAAWLGVLEGRRRGGRDHAAAAPRRDRDGDRARRRSATRSSTAASSATSARRSTRRTSSSTSSNMTAITARASWRRAPRRSNRCRPSTPAATTRR